MQRRRFTWALILATTIISLEFKPSSALALDDDSAGAIDVTNSMSQEDSSASSRRRTTIPPKGTVGRKAAEKYMGVPAEGGASREVANFAPSDHFLAIHFGIFTSDTAYNWGLPNPQSNVGRWNIGVTYRVGEWVNSMDLGLRVDMHSFNLGEGGANRLSFLPVIMFPDANSKFPLYFGIGAGPGIFLNQIGNKSVLSLDYQLFGGVRFFDVMGGTGFFVEAGLKNHFLLLSDGQFNGTFAAAGLVFSF